MIISISDLFLFKVMFKNKSSKSVPSRSQAGMGNGTGVGTGSLRTHETGENITGTVPGQKSLGHPNPKCWDSGN